MNMLDLMNKITQLSEAVKEKKGGREHTAEPGGYGRKDDEDSEGKKVKSDAPKKGRGRPKKDADASGEEKKYDTKTLGSVFGGGSKPKKEIGKVSKKHSLKEYFDQLESALNEAEQIQIKPASQIPKKPGQTSMPGQPQQGQTPQNTQVIQQGNKTLGTVNNPQLAQQIKQSIGKGEMTLMPGEEMEEGLGDIARNVGGAVASGAKKVVDRVTGKTARDAEEARIQKRLNRPSLISQMRSPEGEQNRIDSRNQEQEFDRLSMGDRYAESAEEGLGGMARKVGGALKTGAKAVAKAIVGKNDAELLADLKHRAGVSNSQNGKPSMAKSNEEVDEASYSAKAASAGHDIGKPGKNFSKIEKSAGGGEKGKRIAGAVLAKLRGKTNEGELPVHDGDQGAGLGAGRSQGMLEAKKPDANKNGIPDYAEDGKGKNDLKKKTKVKEGMEHRLKAAHHRGKAHALAKESYNCKYDDMEESRMYHEGYKEGLDECYGQMPVQGYVGEMGVGTEVDDMASFGAHTPELDEVSRGNWMKQQAKSTSGDTFKAFGQTFQDKDVLETDSVFESWDNQLGSLLEEYDTIQEGMTVSISKGQQGAPDSVSVTAQDGEADQLLQVIKQAGLGLFGGDDAGQAQSGQSSAMSLQPTNGGAEDGSMEIGVVDDHDGMMDLIRKVTGGTPQAPTQGFGDESGQDSSDYEDEEGSHDQEHDHDEDEMCESCGSEMHEGDCSTDENQEVIGEVESEDQMEYEVAEDNAPDSGAAETTADENAEAAEDQALATVDAADEEKVDESYANSDDDQFETDIDFMTKVISGGLNKQKSTGQTTVPVIAHQGMRTGVNESVNQWKKLAGIK